MKVQAFVAVRDGVLRRTTGNWLAAGVLEGTQLSHPDARNPARGSRLTYGRQRRPSRLHWTSGSNGTRNHVCAVVRAWSVSPTTLSWCSATKRMLAGSWRYCRSVSAFRSGSPRRPGGPRVGPEFKSYIVLVVRLRHESPSFMRKKGTPISYPKRGKRRKQ